jgi:hypothetical protein
MLWTSYSPGESSRKADSRLVGIRMPFLLAAPLLPTLSTRLVAAGVSSPKVGCPSGWL